MIVSKWLVLVRLLLGDIPERADFDVDGMTKVVRDVPDASAGGTRLGVSIGYKVASTFERMKQWTVRRPRVLTLMSGLGVTKETVYYRDLSQRIDLLLGCFQRC